MSTPEESLSVSAAARRLGVLPTTVWRMIADGELDVVEVQRGTRTRTRVLLPEQDADVAASERPLSRTARLQAQVDQLTGAVDRLSLLLQAERARRLSAPVPEIAPEVVQRFPLGMTARPNPMTHPASRLPSGCSAVARDDALAPVRALFHHESGRRSWWKRLPLVERA